MAQRKRVLVTGVNGFVGKHLVAELVSAGHEVVGVGLGSVADELSPLLVDYLDHDLEVSWPRTGATSVVHLAALSAVGPSFDEPQRYLTANSAMVVNLGQHELHEEQFERVVIVSSGAVYDANQTLPIAEDGAIAFNSPYTVSKILVENIAQYYLGRGFPWVVARPFNHVGPKQGRGFLVPDLYRGLQAARQGGTPLQVGDLGTARDYTDVRDVVRAYRLLLEVRLTHHLYNVCSGKSVQGHEVLSLLQDATNIRDIAVELEPSKVRPNDPRAITGDARRLKTDTGWEPEIPLIQTVKEYVSAPDPKGLHRPGSGHQHGQHQR